MIVEEKIKECLVDGKEWFGMEPGSLRSLVYHAFGLCGETGEVQDLLKKSMRDGTELKDLLQYISLDDLEEELMDVFVHWCNLWGQIQMLGGHSATEVYDAKRRFNVSRFCS